MSSSSTGLPYSSGPKPWMIFLGVPRSSMRTLALKPMSAKRITGATMIASSPISLLEYRRSICGEAAPGHAHESARSTHHWTHHRQTCPHTNACTTCTLLSSFRRLHEKHPNS
eukprot:365347-Chlamydomonas_euryale.AAC.7